MQYPLQDEGIEVTIENLKQMEVIIEEIDLPEFLDF